MENPAQFWVEINIDAIGNAPRLLGRRLSLRDVIRMLERGEVLEARPRLQ